MRHILRRIVTMLMAAALLLSPVSAFADYRDLSVGASGKDVTELKKALYYLGYFTTLNFSDKYNDITAERVSRMQRDNGLEETGVADVSLQEMIFTGKIPALPGAPGPTPTPTPVPTPVGPQATPSYPVQADTGLLAPGSGEYVYSDTEDGLWIYISDTLKVEIRRYYDKVANITWFETEVITSDASPLTTYLTPGNNPGMKYQKPRDIAADNKVVLAITDDFFSYRVKAKETVGIIIRNGEIINEKTTSSTKARFPSLEVLAVFGDGSMKTFAPNEYTAQEYLDMGVTNAFSFGPVLVRNGELGPNLLNKNYYPYREPRMAIGMLEPNHYIILTVNGRVNNSRGAYFTWLADKMLEKGAVEAFNLDGGGTTALVFMGQVLNKTGSSPRAVGSIIGFGQSDLVTK